MALKLSGRHVFTMFDEVFFKSAVRNGVSSITFDLEYPIAQIDISSTLKWIRRADNWLAIAAQAVDGK